jgi:predicted transcriptional regulator
MNQFDKLLNIELHKHKLDTGYKTWQVADNAGISRQTLYNFQSGVSSLNQKNQDKLITYLKLQIQLTEDK